MLIKRVLQTVAFNQFQKAQFFGFFKKDAKKKDEKKKEEEESDDDSKYDPNTWKHLGPMIDKIKQENSLKPKLLPIQSDKYAGKLTVVMELDQVLSFNFEPDPREMFMMAPMRDRDYYLDLPEHDTFVYVYKRENLSTFLTYFLNETEPVIWSQGNRSYVEKVINLLCPEFPREHILTQEHCNLIEVPEEDLDHFMKDIDRLGRDLKRVVYVDANPLNFWGVGNNALPVSTFVADNTETNDDLLRLIEELEMLRKHEDVRVPLAKRYKIEELQKETKMIS